jgi:hypothetical protein
MLNRSDREVVEAAVTQNGLALEFASKKMRADRGIVLKAVNQNGLAFRFAHTDLKNDPDVVTSAVAHPGCGGELRHASEACRTNPHVVVAAAAFGGGQAFEATSEEMRRAPRESGLHYVSGALYAELSSEVGGPWRGEKGAATLAAEAETRAAHATAARNAKANSVKAARAAEKAELLGCARSKTMRMKRAVFGRRQIAPASMGGLHLRTMSA